MDVYLTPSDLQTFDDDDDDDNSNNKERQPRHNLA
jgi:hypothetical protein